VPCHPSVTRIGDWITVSVLLKVVVPPKAGAQVAVVVAMTMMRLVLLACRGMPVALQVLKPEASPVALLAVLVQTTRVTTPSRAAAEPARLRLVAPVA
jgi:hypothetical protein